MLKRFFSICMILIFAVSMLPMGCAEENGHVEVLYIGTTAEPTAFNILLESGSFGRMNYNAFCAAPFVVNDERGFAQPFIMTDWEISEDQKTMTATFATDQGITWHDGEPLTIEDVVFTFEYLINVKKATYTRGITSVEALDDKTVLFTFEGQTPFYVVNKMAMAVYVIPKHIWEGVEDYNNYTEADAAIGCGPFKLVDIDMEAQVLTYERVCDTYLGREVTVDKVVLRTYDSQNALAMAVRSGEIDAVYDYSNSLDPSMKSSLESTENVDAGRSDNPGNFTLMFGMNVQPTDDLAFRKAVSLALDYSLLAAAIGGEDGQIANTGSLPPAANGYDASLPLNTTDLEEAAQILDEAGYLDADGDGWRDMPDGSELDVLITPLASKSRIELYMRICEIIEENLASVNVKATLDEESVRNSDHCQEVRTSAMYEIYIGYNSPGVNMLTTGIQYIVPGSVPTYLEGTCHDQDFIDAFQLARAANNVDEYNERMSKLQHMISENVYAICLCADSAYFPYRTDKYEGWINFPGFGVINNQTWYTLHAK